MAPSDQAEARPFRNFLLSQDPRWAHSSSVRYHG